MIIAIPKEDGRKKYVMIKSRRVLFAYTVDNFSQTDAFWVQVVLEGQGKVVDLYPLTEETAIGVLEELDDIDEKLEAQ
jgi:hypothetical protein